MSGAYLLVGKTPRRNQEVDPPWGSTTYATGASESRIGDPPSNGNEPGSRLALMATPEVSGKLIFSTRLAGRSPNT